MLFDGNFILALCIMFSLEFGACFGEIRLSGAATQFKLSVICEMGDLFD